MAGCSRGTRGQHRADAAAVQTNPFRTEVSAASRHRSEIFTPVLPYHDRRKGKAISETQ